MPDRPLLPEHTVLLVAPLYNRSGYGVTARALALCWHRAGIRFRTVPVNEVADGIDDFDMDWLRSMETTPLRGRLAAVFLHVPGQAWLDVPLPPGCARIMFTTFDSSAQGHLPPADWIRVCNRMDQVWLQSEQEVQVWIQAGLQPVKACVAATPHAWVGNPELPPVCSAPRPVPEVFRFLTIGMFQPRRRWDALIESFLAEFAGDGQVELYLKVNYPDWHPVPGQPQRDLANLIRTLQDRIPSRARVTLDETIGTRLGICRLIDGCDAYVSTDTCITAPIIESLVRARRVVMPASFGAIFPDSSRILIPEESSRVGPMSEAMLAYQPHHRGQGMPLLQVDEIRSALRIMRAVPLETLRRPWEAWEAFLDSNLQGVSRSDTWHRALARLWARPFREDHRVLFQPSWPV